MEDRPHLVFFDFRAAYDSVSRPELYRALKEKGILSDEKIDLLRFIHQNLRISMGGREVTTSRGVPQGLPSSPPLFNVLSEPILVRLEEIVVFARMYADDLVCVCRDQAQATRAILAVEEIARRL